MPAPWQPGSAEALYPRQAKHPAIGAPVAADDAAGLGRPDRQKRIRRHPHPARTGPHAIPAARSLARCRETNPIDCLQQPRRPARSGLRAMLRTRRCRWRKNAAADRFACPCRSRFAVRAPDRALVPSSQRCARYELRAALQSGWRANTPCHHNARRHDQPVPTSPKGAAIAMEHRHRALSALHRPRFAHPPGADAPQLQPAESHLHACRQRNRRGPVRPAPVAW